MTVPGASGALVVDAPLGAAQVVLAAVRERRLTLETIVLTHAHWDHVADAGQLEEATGAAVMAHRLDVPAISQPQRSAFFPQTEVPAIRVSRELDEGDTIEVGGLRLVVMHTPGHTPGSLCLYSAEHDLLFSGDTLFAGSYGRVDLPGGDAARMVESLRRLAKLPEQTVVLPGHGPSMTIGAEGWLRRLPRGNG
ncbi:MAG: MBL fold metallo-hydrolase [Chloroflexi bacterium]|nr:MBL fold metallo-hydrolase [Chloroflexota bacterium]